MGKQSDDDAWLNEPVDKDAFERTLEGQTILGTGGKPEGDDAIYLTESDQD